MTSKWPLIRLGDHIDSTLGKMLDKNKNKGSEKPYLANINVRWGGFDLAGLSLMRFEEKENDRYGIVKGDLIICEGGSEPGRCAIWDEELPDMKIQKALHRVRVKPTINNKYLYYWFLYAGHNGLLEPYFTGTTITHLTGKALNNLQVPLPPLHHQEYTAEVLGSLDDKRKLLSNENAILEEMAQAVFKSWFVDFDPVKAKIAALQAGGSEKDALLAAIQVISGKPASELSRLQNERPEHYANLRATAELFPSSMQASDQGEIPRGWRFSHIGDEVVVVGGGTPSTKNPKYWDDGHINWTTPKDLSNLSEKVLIDTERKITEVGLAKISSGLLPVGTVLMSSRAPVGYLALAKTPVAVNQGYIAMKCDQDLSPEFVIQWCSNYMDEIKSRASGTTFAEISKRSFKVIPVVCPDSCLIKAYSGMVYGIYSLIENNVRELDALGEIRDALLPKLLSGELTVPEEGAEQSGLKDAAHV